MSWSTLPEAIFFFFCVSVWFVGLFLFELYVKSLQFKDRGDIEQEGLSGNQQRNYFFVVDKTAL